MADVIERFPSTKWSREQGLRSGSCFAGKDMNEDMLQCHSLNAAKTIEPTI